MISNNCTCTENNLLKNDCFILFIYIIYLQYMYDDTSGALYMYFMFLFPSSNTQRRPLNIFRAPSTALHPSSLFS